jgi:predicted nucleotidyltransferase
MEKLETYKKIIMPIIQKYAPNAKIIVYGSRARQDAREGSDIDIALDSGSKIDTLIMSYITGDLEESNLVIPFDIVDFHAMPEDMQENIIKDGVKWN